MSDKLFEARLSDMTDRCERSGAAVFSNFLDERQCAEAEHWCMRNAGGLKYRLWGGYDGAGRKMLAVYPDYFDDEFIPDEMPMKCITFAYRKEDSLSHRDFLGSFMALCLKREVIGDIVTGEGITQVFATEIAARDILSSVSKIGRVGVKVTDERPFELENIRKFKDISGTVASLRSDCIVSLAANISRENAARLIRSERVEVNHLPLCSVSAELKVGDIISIRGSGRYIISGINGLTKKNRIHINLCKYI